MGAGKVISITTAAEFEEIIAKNPTVVVDFFATWCGPCKVISPKFHAFSNDFDTVVFIEVDVDKVPEVAETAGIRAMPTFQLYKEGKLADEVVGADPAKLTALIEKHK
ncbi:thioredoxin [Batrachochytrium dendrobatidis JEL423]|nr:thioredoxin [Batrachochytrium dendrobatidis JEL423]